MANVKQNVLLINVPTLSDETAACMSNFIHAFAKAFDDHYDDQLGRFYFRIQEEHEDQPPF